MTRRTLPLAVTALALTAPTADAAVNHARFVAYVEGKQTTTWTMDRHVTGGDCQGTRYRSGKGTETVRFESKPTKVLVFRANPRAGLQVRYGTWDRFAQDAAIHMAAKGKINRTGRLVDELEVGECGPPTIPETPRKHDCGPERWNPTASFHWNGNRVTVETSGGNPPIYANCPIFSADGVQDAFFTDGVTQRYPVRDVLDPSQGLVEVLGRKRWQEDITYSHAHTSTTLRWKLRLRRAR